MVRAGVGRGDVGGKTKEKGLCSSRMFEDGLFFHISLSGFSVLARPALISIPPGADWGELQVINVPVGKSRRRTLCSLTAFK